MINLDGYLFDPKEKQLLLQLLGDPAAPLSLERLWSLMDQVWDESGCDSSQFNATAYTTFYRHPIWLLNGIFIELDAVSMQHRHAITAVITAFRPHTIVDFGGGFGTLSRLLAEANTMARIDVCEPYPPRHALKAASRYSNIHYVSDLRPSSYDALVCTDVLEHVFDPLRLLAEFSAAVKPGGHLVIANCFYPVIKCHLPSTFHLRYTFDWFARLFGLAVVGDCIGSHARIYRRTSREPIPWPLIRSFERLSNLLFPVLLLMRNCLFALRSIRRRFGQAL